KGYPALLITKDNRARIEGPPFRNLDNVWTAVCGFTIVLQKSKVIPGVEALHPRTAAGISADGRWLILLVVDGRQARYSGGAKTAEIGSWLLAMGCAEGINLDGGGTSTMVIEGRNGPQILNRPIHAGIPGNERVAGSHLGLRAAPLRSAR
ncbi:MAG: phosphodiester glycosidase family protein, partial [Verrucomicrobiales bacterium]|nr:phosphodiester glycosidase family protein [Verrucomicrobiales bacterium]